MKLNSVELKKLILEVMEEATRREFLRGLAGAGASAALGADAFADEGDGFEGASVYGLGGSTARDQEIQATSTKPPVPAGEAKAAMDALRYVPHREYYSVAPAADAATGQAYAYVDIGGLWEEMDNSLTMGNTPEVAREFYNGWTLKQIYKYVFGQLAFWGTELSPDPNNMKMAPTIKSQDRWDRDINVKILPLAWTISLDVWMEQMLQVESDIRSARSQEEVDQILQREQLTEQEYQEMLNAYNQVMSSLDRGAAIFNPSYTPEDQ